MRGSHASVVEDEGESDQLKIPERGIARCECVCECEAWGTYNNLAERQALETNLRQIHSSSGCPDSLLKLRYEPKYNGS